MNKILATLGLTLIATATAHATTVSFASTSQQQHTYFAGQVQQSVLTFNNGAPFKIAPTSLDLVLGVPQTVTTHMITGTVGVNDGSFNGPVETYTFGGSFQIGGQPVQFTQDVRFKQIANNEFQIDVAAVAPASVFVEGLGTVSYEIAPGIVQLRAGSSGSGQLLFTTFTLTSAVPEPASALSLLLGLACLPVAVRVARRA
jgi:hypothetical protein